MASATSASARRARRSSAPMTPCSSGNSPTMPVDEVGLGSRAARPRLLGARRPERAARARRPAPRSARPARAMVPSLAWKVTPFELLAARSSSGPCGPRPRRTGRRTAAPQHALVAGDDRPPPSLGLDVGDDEEVRRELAVARSRTAKYFWCVRMEVRITSGGRSRKARRSCRPGRPAIRPGRRPRPAGRRP